MFTRAKGALAMAVAGVFVMAVACSGGGGSGSTSGADQAASTSESSIHGSAVKGPISHGTVKAYAVNADGSRGALLGATTTDAKGDYTLNFSHSGPVEVVISGGTYIDEATGATVDFSGKEMNALVTGVSAGDTVVVTPISAAAARAAKGRMAVGESPDDAVNNANAQVAQVFGIDPDDITSVKPSDYTNGEDGGDAANAYALAIAALSQMVKNNGGDPVDVVDLAIVVGDDLADGSADGDATDVANGLGGAASQLPRNATTDGVIITPSVPDPKPVVPAPSPTPTPDGTDRPCSVGAPTLTARTDTTLTLADGGARDPDGVRGWRVALYSDAAGMTLVGESYTGAFTLLTYNTGYYARTVAECLNGATGQYETKQSRLEYFATLQDMTPPVIDALFPWLFNDLGALDPTGMFNLPGIWTGTANLNEAATGYCIALPTGSTAPTSAQVKAHSAAGIVSWGTGAFSANLPGNCQMSGLTNGVTYDFYFVAEDVFGNLQLAPVAVLAHLMDTTPPTSSQFAITIGGVAQAAPLAAGTLFEFTIDMSETGSLQVCKVATGSVAPTMLFCENLLNLVVPAVVYLTPNVAVMTLQTSELAGEAGLWDYYLMGEDLVNNHILKGPVNTAGPYSVP
ncbi:MAG: hypothetical protein HQK87_02155 [Nitrospinae bacterium]|nr:hypothetical protein [Nitrospinota bacterium]